MECGQCCGLPSPPNCRDSNSTAHISKLHIFRLQRLLKSVKRSREGESRVGGMSVARHRGGHIYSRLALRPTATHVASACSKILGETTSCHPQAQNSASWIDYIGPMTDHVVPSVCGRVSILRRLHWPSASYNGAYRTRYLRIRVGEGSAYGSL